MARMQSQLAIVDQNDCEGCGACCMHVGVPLGYGSFAIAALRGIDVKTASVDEGPDLERWRAMPQQLRAEIGSYYDAHVNHGERNREGESLPCFWLDESTRRCRNYEWRPDVCRDFAAGTDGCQWSRDEYGVGPHKQ